MSTNIETPTEIAPEAVPVNTAASSSTVVGAIPAEGTISTPMPTTDNVNASVTVSDETTTASTTSEPKIRREKKIDYLDEDPMLKYELSQDMLETHVFRQQFFVCSFVSPEHVSNCRVRAFKIRGVYPSEAEANKACEHFRDLDGGKFNNFVGSIGKWSEFDPDPKKIANQVHADERLNTLMKGYLDNHEKTKKVHDDRVSEVQRRSKQAPKMNQIMDRMHGKLDKLKEDREKAVNTDKLIANSASTSAEQDSISTASETPLEESKEAQDERETTPAMSVAARRRLKEQVRKTTEESLAAQEKDLLDRQRKLAVLREEMQRRTMKTQQLSADVEDIRASYEAAKAKNAGQ